MEKKSVYLDHAATTFLYPSVQKVMERAFQESFANASSAHSLGLEMKKQLEAARSYLLSTLHGEGSGTLYFTSGGTEGDNWAIKGVADSYSGKHIITSKIEHNAILQPCHYLEKKGYDVTYLDVDSYGSIDLKQLEEAIRPDTILISILFANNEIGTIQPIRQIGEIARRHGILFHTDAVQAYAQISIDVEEYNIDLLSISSHKFHGPKGVGFLYVGNRVRLEPLMHGGSQEAGLRGGTVNVPGILGMQEAAKISFALLEQEMESLIEKRTYFIEKIQQELPCAKLNGATSNRLPNNANFSFRGYSAGKILDALDQEGIYVSTGSACASGSGKPSHVLEAIGLEENEISSSIRFTLSASTSKDELDFTVEALKKILRRFSQKNSVNIFSINF